MEKKQMLLNTLLAVVLAAGLLGGMVVRAFVPNVVLPRLDLVSMAALVLIALLLEYLIAGVCKRQWPVQIALAAVTFLVLPWAADLYYAGIGVAVCAALVFTVLTWLFDSVTARLEVVTNYKFAVIPTAFVLYLACQCLMGIV